MVTRNHCGHAEDNIKTVSANYVVQVDDYIIRVDTAVAVGPVQITLPAISTLKGKQVFIVKDVGSNASVRNITVVPSGADTIDGQPSLPMNNDDAAAQFHAGGSTRYDVY